jgi:hypothetical protein
MSLTKTAQFIKDNRDPLTPLPKYFTYYGEKTEVYRVEGREKIEMEEKNERIKTLRVNR